jgi:hypothetical protein
LIYEDGERLVLDAPVRVEAGARLEISLAVWHDAPGLGYVRRGQQP